MHDRPDMQMHRILAGMMTATTCVPQSESEKAFVRVSQRLCLEGGTTSTLAFAARCAGASSITIISTIATTTFSLAYPFSPKDHHASQDEDLVSAYALDLASEVMVALDIRASE